jgi:hypothetical protein
MYGGLIVNRLPWHRHAGGPCFGVGHEIVRQILLVQARKHGKTPMLPSAITSRFKAGAHSLSYG